jgi:hypothetical protein
MKRNREIICGGIAFLVSAVFFVCCLQISALSEAISSYGNLNILVYGMTLVLFCGIFIAGMFFMGKKDAPKIKLMEHPKVKWGVLLLIAAGQALFFAVGAQLETAQVGNVAYKYVWHTQPILLMTLLFILEAVVFFYLYSGCSFSLKDGRWILPVVYAVLTILIFYSMYTPNIFGRGEWGDSYHGHAYFNSIYNVYWGMPFTGELTSIYGHYALFWKLPMKLVGGDFKMFVLMIAALGALTHLGAFLVLHQTVKSKVMRVLGALAVSFPILGMRGGYYWQVWPHRMVFPVIMLLFALWVFKKKKVGAVSAVVGYLICMAGVVWNTETGMILAVSWAAVHISYLFSGQDATVGRFVRRVLFHGAGVAASFLGAFGIVNLYNILKHSPANTIQEFLIPLMSDSYMTDVLQLEVPMYPSAYAGELLLLLIGTAMGISAWTCFRKNKEKISWEIYLLFFLSVSALGRLVYYMNRPAYHNLDCCHFSVVILLAYLGERGLRFVKSGKLRQIKTISFGAASSGGINIICATAVLAMSTGTILQFSQNSQIRQNFHNMNEVDSFTQTVAEQIPENTFAFGLNATEIYSYMHWNTQCFTMDFCDLFVAPESAVTLEETLKEEGIGQVFTSRASLPIWEKFNPEGYQWFCENYELTKTFPMNSEEFQYYEKRGE